MAKKQIAQKREGYRRGGEALFIPAGLFIGLGVDIMLNTTPAGMFIGLGAGFLLFALFKVMRK